MDRWQHVSRLYHEALARAEGERAAFLGEACADGDARLELDDEQLTAPDKDASSHQPIPARPARRLTAALWTLSGLLAGGLIVGIGVRFVTTTPPEGVTRFTMTLPQGVTLDFGMALSPDGRTLVYSGTDAAGTRLYKRTLDTLESVPRPSTSVDGRRPLQ